MANRTQLDEDGFIAFIYKVVTEAATDLQRLGRDPDMEFSPLFWTTGLPVKSVDMPFHSIFLFVCLFVFLFYSYF